NQLRTKESIPGEVPARRSKAGNEVVPYRIAHTHCDNRNCAGRPLRCTSCGCSRRNNDINLECNQLIRQIAEPLQLPLSITTLDNQVSSLDVAEIAQPVQHCLGTTGYRCLRARIEIANSRDLRDLFRAGRPG